MKNVDRIWLSILALAGLFIWLHDRAWMTNPDDAWPLLVALPVMAWLIGPRALTDAPFSLSRSALAWSGGLFVAGLVTDLNLLLALAWTAGLWAWLGRRLAPEARVRAKQLLPLAVLAFPWLTLDFPMLGWWCRLSAAWTAEQFFQFVGFAVHREGIQLFVTRMPFEVTPACSGMKALQAMLIAGTALCFLQIGHSRAYWAGVGSLVLAAWLANTLRVIMVVSTALSMGTEFATGWFHTVGGWTVIMLVFGAVCFGLEYLGRNLGAMSQP